MPIFADLYGEITLMTVRNVIALSMTNRRGSPNMLLQHPIGAVQFIAMN